MDLRLLPAIVIVLGLRTAKNHKIHTLSPDLQLHFGYFLLKAGPLGHYSFGTAR
jgi:hypothetical protein